MKVSATLPFLNRLATRDGYKGQNRSDIKSTLWCYDIDIAELNFSRLLIVAQVHAVLVRQ
jgi:hypothetical protein